MFNFNALKMIKSKSVNFLDISLLGGFLTLIIYFIYLLMNEVVRYKVLILVIFGVINLTLIIIRFLVLNKKYDYESNVLDLKEIYDKKIDISRQNFVLLEEKEVSYDLLRRKNIINQLYNTLIKCNPSKSFTIGLQGPWGTGKTTIVNNTIELLKKNKLQENFIIIKFDPWDYDNEKAMLKGLIDKIFNGMNLNFNLEDVDQLVEGIIEVVFYDVKPNLNSFFKLINNNIMKKSKVENMVNNYLQNENKKLLLIVDNMDRIDVEKIKFLLKSVSTILNFEKTIYVLLYDERIIEKELNKMFNTPESNAKYLDKIIQLKIDVPPVDVDIINLIKDKVSENLLFDGQPILSNVLDKNITFDNLRELKIFINNILSSIDSTTDYLNFKDVINLDFIKSKNIDLYYSIWKNKSYYITDDRQYDPNIYTISYEKLNEKAIAYFDDLFENENNLLFENVLRNMFPNVNNYFENRVVFNTNYRNKDEYYSGIKENKIYNTRYFDLYFTKNENDFIWINNEVHDIIHIINNKTKNVFETKLRTILQKYNYDELKVLMEVFELHLNDIKEIKRLGVIKVLYKYTSSFSDRILFFAVDSRTRTQIIISKLLNMSSKSTLEEFCNNISNDYKNLNLIDEIKYWITNESNKKDDYIKIITDKYNEMCSDILEKNIDIYKNKHYAHSNIWSLYRNNPDSTKEYLIKIVSKENIFRILRDIISVSTGTRGYGYLIKQETKELLLPSIDIDKYLTKEPKELNEGERFIKEIYDFYKQGDKGYEDSIYKNEFIEFRDI